MDSKLKISALLEITKSSDLDDDWQWLQDNAFEFQNFYDHSSVQYVCNVFKQKWIYHGKAKGAFTDDESNFDQFASFKHTSPMII